MDGVKANSGVRMENTRLRNPSIRQLPHSRPVQVVLLAPKDQYAPPEPSHPIAKCRQAVDVSRYRVVVEVALHDRPEPCAGLRHRIMHAADELLLDLQQLGPHPLADCLALQRKAPIPVLPADMREAQKVERLGFSFSSSFPVLSRQIARTQSGASCPGAVPARTSAAVPGNPPENDLHRPDAGTPVHCRPRSGRQ